MSDAQSPFQNPRARTLLDSFQKLSREVDFTVEARRAIETYFYSNFEKFAAAHDEERLLKHWEMSFPIFAEEVRSITRSRGLAVHRAGVVEAIKKTARRYYSSRGSGEDTISAEEKIPPPDF